MPLSRGGQEQLCAQRRSWIENQIDHIDDQPDNKYAEMRALAVFCAVPDACRMNYSQCFMALRQLSIPRLLTDAMERRFERA